MFNGVNSARFVGEKCDKEERNRHYVEHDRIVMEETGRIVLSFYTIAMCALMLMLTNPSKKRDATTLKGLSDSPEMQNKLISFFEFTKEATQEVFGEHNSIKKMMKNRLTNCNFLRIYFKKITRNHHKKK